MKKEELRTILFYNKTLFTKDLKELLRLRSNIIDIRKGPKYMEVDILGDYSGVITTLGDPLFKSNRFEDFSCFWDGRFWEAHEAIESLWRGERDLDMRNYYQALILVCASMIKFYKGELKVSDDLMEKALSLLTKVPGYKREEAFKKLISDYKKNNWSK
ncbi:DUF309 domain-containing protein [Sulfuracidifex tepidarius]|uniref:DUF309 domain-containing protein n=1 Tax=Sulfuracidifex tepidarius TaxID=1294262 RepID=UPI001E45770A|nr:DUF309 domain-containing protein [Sulfuracidifex tepidarius]